MTEQELGNFSESTKLDDLSKEVLIQKYGIVVDELKRMVRENYSLRNQEITKEQLNLILQEQLEDLQHSIYGSSSERYKKPEKPKVPTPPKPRIRKPSERYPNATVIEQIISIDPPPNCKCCGSGMSDSGMTEDSEQLTVIPKKYEVILQKKKKYRCGKCHGDIQTAPSPARIKEGSVFSDEMIQDVSLSKYCDLIPIGRYAAMAGRAGLMDLPPHSLIEATHYFADFVIGAYQRLEDKILSARVLHADETPHKMLEGSDTKSWYLWGFSTPNVCYLECHNTRSGDVASNILLKSRCEILITDVFSGYGRAIRISNEVRIKNGRALIINANCNAHSRRHFIKSRQRYTKASEFYLDHYHEIYQLNSNSKGEPPNVVLELRSKMRPRFEAMKEKAIEDLPKYPADNKLAKAMRYFVENYEGLTLFLTDAEVAIDNNPQERLFRSPVVGRKTWYGTHSERGARTAAILFSLVESCKINGINPREYFKTLVDEILQGKPAFTPCEFNARTMNHEPETKATELHH